MLSGIFGIVFNEKNFLITMLCIELTYLGASFILIINSIYFFEPTGQLYALILIITAAAEAAVGLGLLIVVYRYEKRIDFPGFISLAS